MTVRTFIFWLTLFLLLTLSVFGAYWFFVRETDTASSTAQTGNSGDPFPVVPGKPLAPSKTGTARTEKGSTEEVGQLGTSESAPLTTRGKLTLIGSGPIAGATLLSTNELRYVEQTTGHVYSLGDGETAASKLSNTTIPKIQEVYWSSRGDSLALRVFRDSLNTIENLLGVLSRATSTTGTAEIGELKTSALPSSIVTLAVSPDKKSLFYLNRVGDGVVGIVSDFENKKQSQVFDSLLTEWSVSWPAPNAVALTPKPSQNVAGTLYLVDTARKTRERVLEGTRGLTALVNPLKSFALYSQSTSGGFLTSLFDIKNKTSNIVPDTTFPEKCTWSTLHPTLLYCGVPAFIPNGNYPDDWYTGITSFQDRIIVIDTESAETHIVLDTNEPGILDGADAINLMLDQDETNLYFTNKKDGTLWKLNLDEE